ncbi:MAG TPA: glycosyltransferase [Chitinophagales bacterium]|nr:glycosyltransferase [Chitinophagales bacterium]
MPTYNRFNIVQETIQKTIAIHSLIEFEIIVVNDGEPLPFKISHPKLTILKNPKKGVTSARNYGAAHAQYAILFFIDDDMWITAESLMAIDTLHKKSFFDQSCAVLNWKYPDTLIQRMKSEKVGRYLLQANYHTLEGRLNQKIDRSNLLQAITIISSGSFIMSKKNFFTLGGYTETFRFSGEDEDLSERLLHSKIQLFLYTPISCFHNQSDRLSIDHFLKRETRGYFSLSSSKYFSLPQSKIKLWVYTSFIPFRLLFVVVFYLVPNYALFDFITFKTIGILSSIIYFSAWYATDKTTSSKPLKHTKND